jgi:hypothetical protein
VVNILRRDALFAGGDLRTRLKVGIEEIRAEIQSFDPDRLLQTDPGELADYLVAKGTLEVPRLLKDKIYLDEPTEAKVNVSQDSDRVFYDRSQPFYVTGTTFTYHIPFEGSEELLLLAPSTSSSMHPEGKATTSHEITWSFTSVRPQDTPKQDFERNLARIEQYLSWVDSDARPWITALPGQVRSMIEERRQRLIFDRQRAGDLGYPVRRRDDAPETYRVPMVRKKAVTPPQPSTKPAGWEPEPTMAMEIYEDVLRTVASMVEVISRSPGTFRSLDEEGLRDHFLVQLNGQYEGGASGETFNGQGKTDILLRANGKVVFVAECKFWHGARSLANAIDQVLSYLSWHDTKAAVIVFHRGRNLTSVLDKIREALRSHAAHVSDLPFESAIGHRALLRHPEDNARQVTLSVLAFQVPHAPTGIDAEEAR